jgi:prepilin-type processing-associated H-X9-DG protein
MAIMVIGVLMSMLFTTVRRAYDAAMQVKCTNNMRQLGLALTMSMDEREGMFPREGATAGGGKVNLKQADAWFNTLPCTMRQTTLSARADSGSLPRERDRSIYICPSFRMSHLSSRPGTNQAVFTYAYNLWIDHADREDEHPGSAYGPLLACADLPRPSQFAVFGEVAVTEYSNMAGKHMYYRHRGGKYANICFADGHVESLFWKQIFVPSNGRRSDNRGVIWDPDVPLNPKSYTGTVKRPPAPPETR